MTFQEVTIDRPREHVAVVEFHRPPHNYFDESLMEGLAEAYEALDSNPAVRCLVLCSEGRNFCAGAKLSGTSDDSSLGKIYESAARLIRAKKPVVAAIQGASIGGGLGLALTADFRVGADTASCSAPFSKLGLHHGFGLTITLPAVIGPQRALDMLYTSCKIDATVCADWGLFDRLVPENELRQSALDLASTIAECAPLAVQRIRRTMRRSLIESFGFATDAERAEQDRLVDTFDFSEGVKALQERRKPQFEGR